MFIVPVQRWSEIPYPQLSPPTHLCLCDTFTLCVVRDCVSPVQSLGLDPTSDRKRAQSSSDFFFCTASSSPSWLGFSTSSCGGWAPSVPSSLSLSIFSTGCFLFLHDTNKQKPLLTPSQLIDRDKFQNPVIVLGNIMAGFWSRFRSCGLLALCVHTNEVSWLPDCTKWKWFPSMPFLSLTWWQRHILSWQVWWFRVSVSHMVKG